jgi:hypothetical protein
MCCETRCVCAQVGVGFQREGDDGGRLLLLLLRRRGILGLCTAAATAPAAAFIVGILGRSPVSNAKSIEHCRLKLTQTRDNFHILRSKFALILCPTDYHSVDAPLLSALAPSLVASALTSLSPSLSL